MRYRSQSKPKKYAPLSSPMKDSPEIVSHDSHDSHEILHHQRILLFLFLLLPLSPSTRRHYRKRFDIPRPPLSFIFNISLFFWCHWNCEQKSIAGRRDRSTTAGSSTQKWERRWERPSSTGASKAWSVSALPRPPAIRTDAGATRRRSAYVLLLFSFRLHTSGRTAMSRDRAHSRNRNPSL